VGGDAVAEERADVLQLHVARRVARGRPAVRHQVLAGALGDDDERVVLLREPCLERG
jgi:hypothetical protein